ncbi:uncharacterized protein [Drosophila virilis]|uniref:uncharacterized protein n=1 Tax=Drosophila virilis TaxID=7244 RepID=UPI00017D377E
MHLLPDRWLLMLLLRKQIRRKNSRLMRYKRQARQRLISMRRIRQVLLENLRKLIDMKLTDTKVLAMAQMKAQFSRTWQMYTKWLRNCQKLHRRELQKVQSLRKQELALNERLRELRKQFRVLPKRQRVIAHAVRMFHRAYRKRHKQYGAWEVSPEHLQNSHAEAEQIRKYMMYGKRKPDRRLHLIKDNISEFNNFWNSEVLRKGHYKRKQRAHQHLITQHIELPEEFIPKIYHEKHRVKPRVSKARGKQFNMNFLNKMLSFKQLQYFKRKLHKIIEPANDKAKKPKPVEHNQPAARRQNSKRRQRITVKEMLDFDVDLKQKLGPKRVTQPVYGSDQLIRFKKEIQTIRKSVTSMGSLGRPSLLSRRSQSSKRSSRLKSLQRLKLTMASKIREKLSKMHSMMQDKEPVKKPVELIDDSPRLPSTEIWLPPAEGELEKAIDSVASSVAITPKERVTDDVNELLRNKSVPAGIRQELKNAQWRLYLTNASRMKRRAGQVLMNIFETDDSVKYRPIQRLLKDVIQGPSMMDILADKETIVAAVHKHYMWKNLYSVYQDLKGVGIPKSAIFKMLREHYLKYINEIVSEAIEKGAKLSLDDQPGQGSPLALQKSSDSFDQYLDEKIAARTAINDRFINEQILRKSKMSAVSTDESRWSGVSLEAMTYRQLKRMDDRYSTRYLQSILAAHARYFNRDKRETLLSGVQADDTLSEHLPGDNSCRGKPSKGQGPQTQQPRKRKVCLQRLYYEPRRTCRQRQADEECAVCECDAQRLEKCIRCGTELPHLPTSSDPSSIDLCLSTPTLAACVHNPQMLQATADICNVCGFVHEPQSGCFMLDIDVAHDGALQQVRRIKEYANCVQQRQQQLDQSADSIWLAAVRSCASASEACA